MGKHSRAKVGGLSGMMPFVVLALSAAAFALVILWMAVSLSALKQENAELKSGLASLRAEIKSGQLNSDELKEIRARLDALAAPADEPTALPTPSPGLTVASFELKFFENAEYKYQSYTGSGMIRSADSEGSYLVLLKKTLKSGGAPAAKKVEYVPVLVVGGTGAFTTDDSAEGVVEKPEYAFEIAGFVRFTEGGGQSGQTT